MAASSGSIVPPMGALQAVRAAVPVSLGGCPRSVGVCIGQWFRRCSGRTIGMPGEAKAWDWVRRVNEMLDRIDHVNLVVGDMQKMVAFYRDVLGMRLTKQAVISGPWIDAVTALSPVEAEVVFLEASSGPGIELIRYRTPEGSRPDGLGRPNVLGFRHIAFRVTDLDRLVAAIEAAGITMLSGVQQVPAAQVDYVDQRRAWCTATILRATCWSCAAFQ